MDYCETKIVAVGDTVRFKFEEIIPLAFGALMLASGCRVPREITLVRKN